jgi:cytochrome P450
MTRLTFRVAAEVLLGEDLGRDTADQFGEWMATAGRALEFTPTSVTPTWIPDRISPETREAAEGVRRLAEDIVERRRRALAEGADDEPPTDMLAMLIAAEDDPAVEYRENQIRDEVVTFLIAGHETTALSLTYTHSLLSWHPEVRERVREEAQAVFGDDPPRYEHVSDLDLARRVFQEAIRLYPPAWAVFRRARDDVPLGEYRVEENSAVIAPQWSVHRDPRYFDDPERFDPSRWERRDPRAVPAYFPFSSGPHACIGRQFSTSGATLAIARLTREFDLDVPEDALDDLRATPTLRPADAIPVRIDPAK